jgi:hypothetical protein
VRLASGDTADSPLGDGTAFIIGPSGIPIPSPTYVNSFDQLYLEPRGFDGTAQALFNPNGLYPITGVKSLELDPSVVQGEKIIDDAVMGQIATGQVDAANPIVIGGYSQSSTTASLAMPLLANQGVPSDDLHFVLVGDPSNPNGGLLERLDVPAGSNPSFPSLGITFTGAGPSDLYPTDVYTHEYDGFADFPRYPIDFLSDLNALLGIAFEHTTYLGLTPEQIDDAIQLPTSAADTLTDYYMIPTKGLPLLDPLLFFGSGGKALYDLLEPDMRILVNLGFGNITDGWNHGDANVPTPLGFLPPTDVLDDIAKQLPQALANGWQQGVTDYFDDLAHPSNPSPGFVTELDKFAETLAGTKLSAFFSSFPTLHDLFDTFPPHTGSPSLDVATALLFNLPEIDYHVFTSELADGNLLDAIGVPIAADLGILPLAVVGAVL